MTGALTIIAWALALMGAVPLAILAIELIAGIAPGRPRATATTTAGTIAVVMPAHDEAAGIAQTLAKLHAIMPQGTRILVIADNCTDDTAARARASGAEVLERTDPDRRGKSFALAFGRDYLASSEPPAVALVLDADCWLTPGSMERLAAAALERQAPAQAVYLFDANHSVSAMVQVSNFAMMVKNLVRSRGMQRLGGPALLTGSGMAFPWPVFAKADLATGSIVEDLALGIELTRAGRAPSLIEGAYVHSAPAAEQDALQQRKRWEHGFLDVLRRQALPVLGHGMKRSSLREIQLGLHLLVPPLALLVALSMLVLLVLVGLAAAGSGPTPAVAFAASLGLVLTLLLITWVVAGRPFLSARALLRLPAYIVWKLPIYFGFLTKRQTEWNRTPRQP